MTEELSSPELHCVTPEEIQATYASLRRLTHDRANKLPDEMRDHVESVTFSSVRKGKPLGAEANLMEIKVRQIFDPWILIELKDSVGSRHIGYILSENGEMRPAGDFTPYSEKPSSELGDELVHNIDFYESLLEVAASEVSVRV